MKAASLLLLIVLIHGSFPAAAAPDTEKRVDSLEKRVTSVENRVKRLETGGKAASPEAVRAGTAIPDDPIGVKFLGKKHILGEQRAGIRIYLRFANLSNRRFFAFNGTLVFRNEKGSKIWEKPYGHSNPLGPGEEVDVSLGLLSDKPKIYLKFVKARSVTVTLKKQEVYGLE